MTPYPATLCAGTCGTVSRKTIWGYNCAITLALIDLMWGSDYPHAESTFPRSREVIDEIMEGVPEDERDQIVGRNAANLYHFN